jgi:hypothetical protein
VDPGDTLDFKADHKYRAKEGLKTRVQAMSGLLEFFSARLEEGTAEAVSGTHRTAWERLEVFFRRQEGARALG